MNDRLCSPLFHFTPCLALIFFSFTGFLYLQISIKPTTSAEISEYTVSGKCKVLSVNVSHVYRGSAWPDNIHLCFVCSFTFCLLQTPVVFIYSIFPSGMLCLCHSNICCYGYNSCLLFISFSCVNCGIHESPSTVVYCKGTCVRCAAHHTGIVLIKCEVPLKSQNTWWML